MADKECEKCKPDKPETHEGAVKQTGCDQFFGRVQECMDKHKGNVTSCRHEWAEFKSCFQKLKKVSAMKSKAERSKEFLHYEEEDDED